MDFFDLNDNEGQEDASDFIVQTADFNQAVIWGTDWTTDTIVNQLNKGRIDLNPKFQRREAWTAPRKSKFIESLILGLPIPQIILAERKDKKGTYIVIDGKQRLLSIRQFFSKADDKMFPRLKLRGIDTLDFLKNKSYIDIVKDPMFEEFATSVENQSIRTIVIKNWPNEEFLYNVFLRLNTGSLPLAPQELRQALHPGPFIDFTDEFSIESTQIKKILNIKKPDYRMRDVELVIRYFSFKYFIQEYNGNLKSFFDKTVQHFNTSWEENEESIKATATELNNAIDFTYSIWGDESFRKWKNQKYEGRFNRAIYDIMVFYFSRPEVRNALNQNKEDIKEQFQQLSSNDAEFLNSFETSTKNMQPTAKRFRTWGQTIRGLSGLDFQLPGFN